MKKFRGKRRYFRRLSHESRFATHELSLAPDSWFNHWHTHLDFYGYGNKNIRVRRQHLQASLALMLDAEQHLRQANIPHQVWMTVSLDDAAFDSVAIHTQNPEGSAFPYMITDPVLDQSLPAWLSDILPMEQFQSFVCSETVIDEWEDEPEETMQTFILIQSIDSEYPLH